MITVYNPYTGQWERLDDLNRAMPTITRNSYPVGGNNTSSFVPTFSTSNSPNQTDLFGNTDASRANIGAEIPGQDVDIIIPDPWRMRRIVIIASRTASGSTSVGIVCVLWGRLLAPDGTPTNWRSIANATESGSASGPIRYILPSSSAGVLAYDQYRITFRRETDSTPAPEITLVRLFPEF